MNYSIGHKPAKTKSNNWVGINWQIAQASGWGVFGINLARELERNSPYRPVPLVPPSIDDRLTLQIQKELEPLVRRGNTLLQLLQGNQEGILKADFPVLHSLGNEIHSKGMPLGEIWNIECTGSRNLAIVFFEDNIPNEHTRENCSKFDLVLGGSTWNKNVLRNFGISNVEALFQGVDPELFKLQERKTSDRFVVFSGGKLEYRKGQDIVVAAFREFHKRHPEATLATVWHNLWPATMKDISLRGHVEGMPEQGENKRLDIVGWLEQNGIPRNAVHDFGIFPNHLMPEAFAQSDVALFTNRCEGGTNLVAMEAMACGVPCIIAANTGQLDLIDDGNCIPLLRQGPVEKTLGFSGTEGWGESDVAEVVDALEMAYSDRRKREEIGVRGALFMRDWSWEKVVRNLLEFIDHEHTH